MINLIRAVLLVINEFLEFLAEKVNFPEIEWTKIGEERFVDEVVVYAEVKCVRSRFRWILVRYPIQALGNNLNRFIG